MAGGVQEAPDRQKYLFGGSLEALDQEKQCFFGSLDGVFQRDNPLRSAQQLPGQTPQKVYFTVGNETKIFKEGEFWEINNSGKVHSVANKSNKGRVNLIADWIT